MKKQQLTAFYLEALLLIAVFVAIILVLTQVFGLSKAQSQRARLLTAAVTLAANTAEAAAGADDLGELSALLNENGNVYFYSSGDGAQEALCAQYDAALHPQREGALTVVVTPTRQDGLISYDISVLSGGETLYRLRTARALKEAAA